MALASLQFGQGFSVDFLDPSANDEPVPKFHVALYASDAPFRTSSTFLLKRSRVTWRKFVRSAAIQLQNLSK
jgi:hypothetical protein